jgi:hypothetical protein
MRRLVLCLVVALAAGCGDEKKPTEPSPAFPQPNKQPPGKKQTGPGMSRRPDPAGGAVRAPDHNS